MFHAPAGKNISDRDCASHFDFGLFYDNGEDLPEAVAPASVVTDVPLTDEEIPLFEGAVSCSMVTDRIMESAVSGTDGGEEDLWTRRLILSLISFQEMRFPTRLLKMLIQLCRLNKMIPRLHQQVWNYFSALIPADQRKMVAVYSITTDGQGGTLAAVSQIQSNANRWDLQVDLADTS